MDALILSLGCAFAHIPTMLLRYTPFASVVTKKQKKILFFCNLAVLVVNFIVDFIVGLTIKFNLPFVKSGFILFGFIITLINMTIIRKRVREHIFVCGLSYILVLALFTVTGYIETFFWNEETFMYALMAFVLEGVAFFLIYPLVKRILTKTITPFLEIETGSYWKNIYLIPCVMFFTTYIAIPLDSYGDSLAQVISRVFMVVATIFICMSISGDYNSIKEKQEIQSQLKMQKKYYESLSENIESSRKARHDFKHHISAIMSFVDNDDKEGLKEYCEGLTEYRFNSTPIPYTGNSSADGVLYQYTQLARDNNVDFKISGIFNSEGIDDLDICVLLGNAVDNAFTACLKKEKDRFVSVTSKRDGGVLAITVQNSFDGVVLKKGDKILSRKRDNREGIGILSMKSICEKYGGMITFDYDENTFSTMILLNTNK